MLGSRAGYPRGKLKAVASAWASGRGGGKPADDAATDAASAAVEAIEARRAGRAPKAGFCGNDAEIAPDMLDAVRLFFSLGSQWRFGGMAGVRLGLDYAAVPATAQMMGIGMTPQLFDDMRIMEGAAMAVFAKA